MKTLIHKSYVFFLSLTLVLFLTTFEINAQVPQGFNYQALVKDASGNPIVSSTLQVKLGILADTTASPLVLWEELHNPVKSNAYGMINLVLGTGTRQAGSANTFSDIDWSSDQRFLHVQVYYQSQWKHMGYSRIWTVPYSMSSGNVNNLDQLSIKGATEDYSEALFAVRNHLGDTVFAVYNKGIRAWVGSDDALKGSKGGFAIGGFNTLKAPGQEFLVITPDSARIYVDETTAKANKGGFAIGGFDNAKGTVSEIMHLSPENYFCGHSSGQLITTGVWNSTLGYQSGYGLTEGSNNVFLGYKSGYSTNTSSNNIFVGTSAGYLNTTGSSNIFVGTSAGYLNTTGYWNIMLGRQAGFNNTTGYANIVIGDFAGHANTTGYDNVMIGDYAGGYNTTGTHNVFLGANSGNQNTEGDYNIFIGSQAGETNTTGSWNTMLGYLAGNMSATVGSQALLGYKAGEENTGGWNTMVGSLAGAKSGTGWFNTYLGLAAGEQATGDNNVFIGRWAGRFESANSNKLVVETLYEGTDNYNNALLYGDFSEKYLRLNGQLDATVSRVSNYAASFTNTYGYYGYGIKIQTGDNVSGGNGDFVDFYNGGGFYRGSLRMSAGLIDIYNYSDQRQKENIKESAIDATDLLNSLRIVDYNFIKSNEVHTGYIAQEAKEVLPEMVAYREKEDVYTITYTPLIPVLHKAILEQQETIGALANKIEELEALINQLLNN